MTRRWTTPDDIAAKARRRWDDGTLLRGYAANAPFEVIDIPVRGPKPSEIGDDLGAVRDWVALLDAGRRDDRRYTLQWQTVGGRHIGRNELPGRAVVSSFGQAWALLGVGESVRRFDEALAVTDSHPAVHKWATAHPHRALELHDEMPRLVAAYEWLNVHRNSGRYLREISAPGVDTKFAERHRSTLAAMLAVASTPSGFLSGLGLQSKPDFVRLRPAPALGLPSPATELAMRAAELADLSIAPRSAIVVENEITYLSVDVPKDGIVIWGKGFDIDRVGRLPWLVDVDVTYWGDIDTHGFAILNRLRAWLPQTQSTLMDQATLMAHRDRWVEEDRPTKAALSRLTPEEHDLYEDFVADSLGKRVRLEQERIDWGWASGALPSQELATSPSEIRPSTSRSDDCHR
jgi:hypothetical protein